VTSVGPVLRRFRHRAGMTQREVAERAGISVGGLRDLEQGRVARPRPANARRLTEVLCLSEEESAQLGHGPAAAGPDLRIAVLGPLTVSVDGSAVELRSAKQRTLLGLLALSPNVPVSRAAVVEVLWASAAPAAAATLVHSHISRLRRRFQPAVEGPALLTGPGFWKLAITDEGLDMLRFRRLLSQARQARRLGNHQQAVRTYAEALQMWRGEPLADVPALADHVKVAALQRERREAVLEFADVAWGAGCHDQTATMLWQLVDEDPLNEAAHARLMLTLVAADQQGAALGLFDRLRHRLADELGVSPGPAVVDAHRKVLRQDVPTWRRPTSRQ